MLERTPWTENRLLREEGDRRDVSGTITAADMVAFLRRHLWTILFWTVATIAAAAAYAFTAKPHYTAQTQLVIDPQLPQTIRDRNVETSFTLDNAQVESQMAVLRSEKIAAIVIARLDLENNPDFQARPGGLGFLIAQVRGVPTYDQPTPFERNRHTMAVFQNGLQVRRMGLSYAIDVVFRSPDPEQAAEIANATVDAYIRDQLETKAETARLGSEWLDQRLAQLRAQMNAAALEVQEFRSRRDYRIQRSARDRPAETEAADPSAVRTDQPTIEDLETKAQAYRRIYESFLISFTESVQRQTFPVPDARVVTQATPPLSPSEPRVKLVLALGGVVGGLLGFGVALGRHNLDRRIRTPRQIREELGIECLGSLPRISSGDASRSRRIARRLGAALGEGDHNLPRSRRDPYFDTVLNAPLAPFSASLVELRTRIGFGVGRRQIKCVGFTSLGEREGKSTLASNLAVLCAQAGARTLLVDADIRAGRLTKSAAPSATTGLTQVLMGSSPLDAALVREFRPHLDFLPSGGLSSPLASQSLLGSKPIQLFLEEITRDYDLIIFDLASLEPSTGALALGAFLETVILVTEWAETSTDAAVDGAYWLRTVQAHLLGAVITKTPA